MIYFYSNFNFCIKKFVLFQVSLDREHSDRMSLETQLREKVRECIDIQAQLDLIKAETNTKYVPRGGIWYSNFK